MINDASVVIGGGNWGIKEADLLGYKLFNNDYYARDIDFATSTADGTYMDSTGYVRRSPYNLFTYSEELDNVLWLKNNITIVPNAGVAPNNTNTAESYASTTTVGPHPCYQSKVVTRNTYTYSVYVKKVNSRYVSLKGAGGMTVWTGVIFDLDTASVVSIQNNNVPGTTGAITSEGNGWYRISMTATSNFNDFGLQYASSPSNNFGNYGDLSIAGSGLVDYLLWGMQVVQGSSPMPYFYTTTRLNVPRIDYSNPDGTLSTTGKLLMEPQRTNSIRNSSMNGAVAGSPGTLPTNWTSLNSGGLTRSVVAVGTENGLPYVDIRINGTATGIVNSFSSETPSGISALSNQVWANSVYIKVIAQPNPPVSYILQSLYANSGAYVNESNTTYSPTATLRRFTATHTAPASTITNIYQGFAFNLTIGQTYDFTIRIAAPQMELGAYATTWIPTTTAAVTRNADAASRTGVSSWIGQTEGTIFLDVEFNAVSSGGIRTFFSLEGSVPGQFSGLNISTTNNGSDVFYAGTTYYLTQGRHKIACTYNQAVNQAKLFVDGAQRGAGTFSGFLASIDKFSVLCRINPFSGFAADRQLFGGDNQCLIFNTALSDAQLAQLTTL